MGFDFRPLDASDVPLLARWLAEPHVARWFGDARDWLDEIRANLGADWVAYFRVDFDGAPAGFAQCYDAARAPLGPWNDEPAGTFGIDFLLGERALIGRGLGAQLVADLAKLAEARARPRRLIADPVPENVASIRALERAGFALDAKSGFYALELR